MRSLAPSSNHGAFSTRGARYKRARPQDQVPHKLRRGRRTPVRKPLELGKPNRTPNGTVNLCASGCKWLQNGKSKCAPRELNENSSRFQAKHTHSRYSTEFHSVRKKQTWAPLHPSSECVLWMGQRTSCPQRFVRLTKVSWLPPASPQ